MSFGLNLQTGGYYDDYGFGNSYNRRNRLTTESSLDSLTRNAASVISPYMTQIKSYLETDNNNEAAQMAQTARAELKTYAASLNYDLDDAQIESLLEKAYAEANKSSLVEDIEANTSSSLWSGFIDAIDVFDWIDSDSTAEVSAKVRKTELTEKDKNTKEVGGILGKVALGAGTVLGAIGLAGAVGGAIGSTGAIAGAAAAIGGAITTLGPIVLWGGAFALVGLGAYALYKGITKKEA